MFELPTPVDPVSEWAETWHAMLGAFFNARISSILWQYNTRVQVMGSGLGIPRGG